MPEMERKHALLALVTGGTRGIGRAIASRMIDEGYQCIITGTGKGPYIDLPDECELIIADLSSQSGIDALAEKVEGLSPSVLINNAGINIKGSTTTFDVKDYDAIQNVNLAAPFFLSRAALKGMTSRSWGRIVNITSLWGLSGNPLNVAYCASKSGLDGMTASIAAEVAPLGILVNAVAPGYVYTEAAQSAFTPEQLADVSKRIPLGRLARAEEVAELVVWLASHKNTYVTGQNILIDGGLTRTASS